MSTTEDFKKAPIGAMATHEDGARALKVDGPERRWILQNGLYLDDKEIEQWGYTLDPLDSAAPTTARGALDLAWELAYPVKEGQIVTEGSEYIERSDRGFYSHHMKTSECFPVDSWDVDHVRTLDPLPDPEPEPDWLDAPAVLAWSRWDDVRREKVWSKDDGCYKSIDGEIANWSDLCYVTPLYPKDES